MSNSINMRINKNPTTGATISGTPMFTAIPPGVSRSTLGGASRCAKPVIASDASTETAATHATDRTSPTAINLDDKDGLDSAEWACRSRGMLALELIFDGAGT